MGQDCVSTNGYGQWNDEYCFYLLNFICEKAQDQAVAFAMEGKKYICFGLEMHYIRQDTIYRMLRIYRL